MGAGGTYGHNINPKFMDDKAKNRHIFRKSEKGGHFEKDTAENREIILDVARDNSNYKGIDDKENRWYSKIEKDGSETWVSVRNGVIQNAGTNRPPKFTEWFENRRTK